MRCVHLFVHRLAINYDISYAFLKQMYTFTSSQKTIVNTKQNDVQIFAQLSTFALMSVYLSVIALLYVIYT